MNNVLSKVWVRIIAMALSCIMIPVVILSSAGLYFNIEFDGDDDFYETYLASSVAHELFWRVYEAVDLRILDDESYWLESIEIVVTKFADDKTKEVLIDTHSDDSRHVYSNTLKLDISDSESYIVVVDVFAPAEITEDSAFYDNYMLFKFVKQNDGLFLPGLLISAAISIMLFVYLMWSAGHTAEGLKLVRLDKAPLDIVLTLVFIIVGSLLTFFEMSLSNWRYFNSHMKLFMAVLMILSLWTIIIVCLVTCMSISTRIKIGKWWRNTLIYKIAAFTWRLIARTLRDICRLASVIPLFWKGFLMICAFLFLDAFFCMAFAWEGEFFLFVLICILNIACIIYVLKLVKGINYIKKFSENISNGEFETTHEPDKMIPVLRKIPENLSNAKKGLTIAVNDKLKSEKFKTELITNVSHDLKTPLTSIINYVDLLHHEKIDNPTAVEYIEILDRQANKLKKLTVDLVDAAKASSGTIPVSLEVLNANELLEQCIGEFSDKFELAGINPIINANEICRITADGRLLSRVIDNLINNVLKYAMTGTRAYFDIIKDRTKTHIFLRNISREQLNISAEELLERFVRGDASRSSEGSGLGLSIARSLTELMNGTLELTLDGDLFKVELTFPNA